MRICFDTLFVNGTEAAWLAKLTEDVQAGALTQGERVKLIHPRVIRLGTGIEVREWTESCEMVIILLTPTEHVIRYELGGIPGVEKTPVHVFGSKNNRTLSSVSVGGMSPDLYTFHTGQVPVLTLFGVWILNHNGFSFKVS